MEDQFGGGWAVEGVRTVSCICVPRGTIRELELWCACSLLGWEPEPCRCVYARSWAGRGVETQGASQGLLLQPSLSLTTSKQKPLCPVHGLWGPCPYFRTKHGYFGKRRTKIWVGGRSESQWPGSVSHSHPRAGVPGDGKAPCGWGRSRQGPAFVPLLLSGIQMLP